MISHIFRGFALAAVFALPTMAQQQSTNRVAANTDWSVFEENEPIKMCWSVSSPKETVNTKDGRVVAVRRGDILFLVSYFPSENVKGQISFTGGYPFRKGSVVSLSISGQNFELFTVPDDDPGTPNIRENEMAWAPTAEDDAKIIAAMKRGAEAVVSGISTRGTATKDTFSLLGFTAALDEAAKRCQ